MEQAILELVSKYPVAAAILMGIGIARAINKPLFALVRAFVVATPSQNDDLVLDKVEASWPMKAINFVLDWSLSVKLPQK